MLGWEKRNTATLTESFGYAQGEQTLTPPLVVSLEFILSLVEGNHSSGGKPTRA